VTNSLEGADVALLERLVRVAVTGLPLMYRTDEDVYAFTRAFVAADQGWRAELRGTSHRYGAIVALGAFFLPEQQQRDVLAGQSLDDFISLLVKRLDHVTNVGDAALTAWAAAQCEHPMLTAALDRLRELDKLDQPQFVVEIAWVVSALAAARGQLDVESYLSAARDRLLGCVHPGSPVFPHVTGPGLVKDYRAHVACFADQVYPIQALARLHGSRADPEALRAAETCAAQICRLQGPDGQWWWHYDARTGNVIEGYPVYTVHQHAMAPMALLDLTDVGGSDYSEAIRLGLRWIPAPAELGDRGEPMIHDNEGVTWRKVHRGDPKKVVRGLNTLTTRAVAGMKVPGLGLVYRPDEVDRECRPYEFGWLFFAWLANLRADGSRPVTWPNSDPEAYA
jgi:hypothetical protein